MIALCRYMAMRLGLYDRLRFSALNKFLLRYRSPRFVAAFDADLNFYRHIFRNRHLQTIFDIGGNFGNKAFTFGKLADKVVCVEPDQRALEALRFRFRKQPDVHVVAAAVGAERGTAELLQQSEGSAYNTLSAKHADLHQICAVGHSVQVITLDELIELHGSPDFLKVDVEGYEAEVFSGLNAAVPLLCFEANLPAFGKETVAVIDRLVDIHAGYKFTAVSNDGQYDFAFDRWESAEVVKAFVENVDAATSYDIFASVAA